LLIASAMLANTLLSPLLLVLLSTGTGLSGARHSMSSAAIASAELLRRCATRSVVLCGANRAFMRSEADSSR